MEKLTPILLFVLLVSQAGARSKRTERTNNVYIAARTDGLEGAGTKIDPFDGSTSTKLDAALRRISNSTTVHFGPGMFLTAGYRDDDPTAGFSVKRNCKYIGAGRDVTTLKVLNVGLNPHLACAFCSSGTNQDVSGASVENMTTDMNGAEIVAANNADLCTYGVSLPGSNNNISNVHLIGMYGHFATLREAFGLGTLASATNSTPSGNLIENCVVDNFASGNDYGQMICIRGGIARNNWVIGQTTLTSAYQAYGANAVLDHCYSRNCRTFLYMDTGDVGPLSIKNCQAWGITGEFVNLAPSAGFTHHDVRVVNNTVEFGPSGTFFSAAAGGAGPRLYNLYVLNNTATQESGLYTPINVNKVRNFHSAGNHWLKRGTRRQSDQQTAKASPNWGRSATAK
jgi:hypothetical protein